MIFFYLFITFFSAYSFYKFAVAFWFGYCDRMPKLLSNGIWNECTRWIRWKSTGRMSIGSVCQFNSIEVINNFCVTTNRLNCLSLFFFFLLLLFTRSRGLFIWPHIEFALFVFWSIKLVSTVLFGVDFSELIGYWKMVHKSTIGRQ